MLILTPLRVLPLLLAIFAALLAPPASPDPGSQPVPVLTVATANLHHDLGVHAFADDLDRLIFEGADLIGLQEAARRANLDLRRPGYDLIRPRIPGEVASRANPILYRTAVLKPLDVGVRKMHGKAAAYPARYVDWAQFRHLPTGRRVFHFNTHINSHIEVNGHPRELPKRVGDAMDHIIDLGQMVEAKRREGIILVTADWNVDYNDDRRARNPHFPYTVMHDAGLRATYDVLGDPGPTHGARLIDVTYYEPGPHVRPLAQTVLRNTHSDHRPVLTDFALIP